MNRLYIFLIISAIVAVLDVYTYPALKSATSGFAPQWQRISKIAFFCGTASILLAFLLFQPLTAMGRGRVMLTFLSTIGSGSVLGKLFFSLWILVADFTRGVQWTWAALNPARESLSGSPISRNEFLVQAGAVTATVPLLAMGWGILKGAHDYQVIKRTVLLPHLPKAFDGFQITQISDLHTGSFWHKSAVEKGIQLVNDQKSQVILFTGDLVNDRASELQGWTGLFSRLRAEYGVFSVLGNHDYGDYVSWASDAAKKQNLLDLLEVQKEMGWRVLINENVRLQSANEYICLAGVENWGNKGRFPQYGDLNKSLRGVEEAAVTLLMSHDPSHWRGQVLSHPHRIDLMLAGHTHGMQFGLEAGSVKWSPVKYLYPEWADLYEESGQFLYVNRGFGYIGFPGRIGILPEITVITLQSA